MSLCMLNLSRYTMRLTVKTWVNMFNTNLWNHVIIKGFHVKSDRYSMRLWSSFSFHIKRLWFQQRQKLYCLWTWYLPAFCRAVVVEWVAVYNDRLLLYCNVRNVHCGFLFKEQEAKTVTDRNELSLYRDFNQCTKYSLSVTACSIIFHYCSVSNELNTAVQEVLLSVDWFRFGSVHGLKPPPLSTTSQVIQPKQTVWKHVIFKSSDNSTTSSSRLNLWRKLYREQESHCILGCCRHVVVHAKMLIKKNTNEPWENQK